MGTGTQKVVKGKRQTHLNAVSSLRFPESSSSDGCLLAFREDWWEFCAEFVREVRREPSREAALREMVLPLSKT